jgi:hypothetical protein
MVARISSHTVNNPVASLDGRTLAARRLKKTRQDLIKHLGHPPNPYEESLVDRVAVLSARVVELEARIVRGVETEQDTPNLMVLIANLHQLLQKLGWESGNPVIHNSNANYTSLDAA